MKVEIEDNKTLERDIGTGAVLNKDGSALLAAKERKRKAIEDAKRINNLEARVQELNTKIDSIMQVLLQLTNRDKGA